MPQDIASTASPPCHPAAQPGQGGRPLWRGLLTGLGLGLGLAAAGPAQAVDFGPWSLTGFAKAEIQRGSNNCIDCQLEANENRHRIWADKLVYSKQFGSETVHSWLFQPYLAFNQALPNGFKLSGLLSQRYRDGDFDIPGAVYERNIGLSHEEYGSLRYGAMTSRSWAVADYPYASDFGISDAWPSSGAGYALLGKAVRYTSRLFDVANGDLVLEATYDTGPGGWKRNEPHLLELWGKYTRDGLMIDAMVQMGRNGQPVAWGHAPFSALTSDPADDNKMGGSSQSIAVLMARYYINPMLEVTGGIRANRWSGAYAVQTSFGPGGLWNNMWNVDWGGTDSNGVPNPGYSARSTDLMAGVRYMKGQWTASTGVVYLGKASTANPSERGQSNTALINTATLKYDFRNGLQVYTMAGMVHFGRKGLAPLSMPSNNAFTNVDPRVATRGNWFGAGVLYTF